MGSGQAHPSVRSNPITSCPLCQSFLLTKAQIINEALGISHIASDDNEERWCECGYIRLVDKCIIYSFSRYRLFSQSDEIAK